MTRRRWIADEVHGNTASLTGEHALHLTRVLRAQVGQEFDIAIAAGVRRGKIVSLSDERVEFALGDEVALRAGADLTLVLAIFKFDRMEWAIEKCTEIGVARIVPVIARRTDAHLATAAVRRHDRWERIARQAAEQSRRAMAPEILAAVKLRELGGAVSPALTNAGELGSLTGNNSENAKEGAVDEGAPRIVLAETETGTMLRDVLPSSASAAALAVGPEGGWTEDELVWFREAGWVSASLGQNILRAETAAIVAVALAVEVMQYDRRG